MDELIMNNEAIFVRNLGQEWVLPNNEIWFGASDPNESLRMFHGAVAVESNCGTLLLTRLEQICSGPNAGQIRRILVKPEELRKEYERAK